MARRSRPRVTSTNGLTGPIGCRRARAGRKRRVVGGLSRWTPPPARSRMRDDLEAADGCREYPRRTSVMRTGLAGCRSHDRARGGVLPHTDLRARWDMSGCRWWQIPAGPVTRRPPASPVGWYRCRPAQPSRGRYHRQCGIRVLVPGTPSAGRIGQGRGEGPTAHPARPGRRCARPEVCASWTPVEARGSLTWCSPRSRVAAHCRCSASPGMAGERA